MRAPQSHRTDPQIRGMKEVERLPQKCLRKEWRHREFSTTDMKTYLRYWLTTKSLLLACASLFLACAGARGQETLSISGGTTTPLTLTLDQAVSFTITSAGLGPYFFFPGIVLVDPYSTALDLNATGTVSFSVNGGASQEISSLGIVPNNYGGPGGLFIYDGIDPLTDLNAGDVVTLSAGTLTTDSIYSEEAVSLEGEYSAFVGEYGGATAISQISSTASPVPEPGTVVFGVALMAVIGLTRAHGARRAVTPSAGNIA